VISKPAKALSKSIYFSTPGNKHRTGDSSGNSTVCIQFTIMGFEQKELIIAFSVDISNPLGQIIADFVIVIDGLLCKICPVYTLKLHVY